MQKSVAIVGGGIVGMSIAWRLAQAGFAVTVYEKSTIGSEASWAGAGMLAPGGEFETESDLARMAIESRHLYPAFVEELQRETGVEIDLQQTGALDVAYTRDEMILLDERAERQKTLRIASKRMQPLQISTFWPRLRKEELAGGYFYPGDAFVNPRQVVEALRVCCQNSQVSFVENLAVSSLQVEPCAILLNNAQYDSVVVAAGAWSGLLELSGTPPLPESQPVRGHLLGYRQPEQICNTIIRHGHIYLLQRAGGLLIVGASTERVGFDRTVDPVAAARLEQAAAFLMPHLSETSPSEIWNGLRPGSDHLQVGPWHSPRLYLAYGHYRNGILLAPATANLVSAGISANLQKQ